MQKYFWRIIVKGIPGDTTADGNASRGKIFHHVGEKADANSKEKMYTLFYDELAAFLRIKEKSMKKKSPLELDVMCYWGKQDRRKMAEDLRLYLMERLRWWWNPQFELDLSAT